MSIAVLCSVTLVGNLAFVSSLPTVQVSTEYKPIPTTKKNLIHPVPENHHVAEEYLLANKKFLIYFYVTFKM